MESICLPFYGQGRWRFHPSGWMITCTGTTLSKKKKKSPELARKAALMTEILTCFFFLAFLHFASMHANFLSLGGVLGKGSSARGGGRGVPWYGPASDGRTDGWSEEQGGRRPPVRPSTDVYGRPTGMTLTPPRRSPVSPSCQKRLRFSFLGSGKTSEVISGRAARRSAAQRSAAQRSSPVGVGSAARSRNRRGEDSNKSRSFFVRGG